MMKISQLFLESHKIHNPFHGSMIDDYIPWNIPWKKKKKTPWNIPYIMESHKIPWFQSPPTSYSISLRITPIRKAKNRLPPTYGVNVVMLEALLSTTRSKENSV